MRDEELHFKDASFLRGYKLEMSRKTRLASRLSPRSLPILLLRKNKLCLRLFFSPYGACWNGGVGGAIYSSPSLVLR
jgi:hypothetical protein